ncbi:hypothetical protein ACFWXB_01665 [Tsukamurella tyrosinosolvens]|uniref:hypothetical protein n=1 Tax=Tsukamurella tyrosinosolvens TaxID=57704 RepID=UPI0011C021D7|nr:hypothetical protein [Tsukamurella tyrosinosolvens]QRY85518.1 hypothetical protein JVY00_05415 [Tsukamurella tyrosinosolvens]
MSEPSATPVWTAQDGTYEEFMKSYAGTDVQRNISTYLPADRTLLWLSVRNKDADARVAISNQLIDDGVNVPYVDNNLNVLNIFLGNKHLVPAKDAPLLRRLLQEGADMNLYHRSKGMEGSTPVTALLMNMSLTEEEKIPMYEVLLEFPEFHYRNDDGSLRWGHRKVLTEVIEAHEARQKQ